MLNKYKTLNKHKTMRNLTLTALLLLSVSAGAQTASGTINATLINKNGITLVFDTDAAGVALGSTGSSAATVNFGTVSAFGPLSAGVTRPVVLAGSYTVKTLFDVNVIQGGLVSASYTLTSNLAAVAPTGFAYAVDAVTLTTAAQTITTTGTYNADVQHGLNLVISTAAPGAGGPAVGTSITATLNFTATAN
jgi:hypothetical protein